MFTLFAQYTKKYRWHILLGCLLIILECVLELCIPLIMADIIDNGIPSHNQPYILKQSAIMLAFAVISLLLGVWFARVIAVASQGFGAELRKAEYKKIQSFSFNKLDSFEGPSLVTRLTSDITILQNILPNGMRPFVRGISMLITSFVMAAVLNSRLLLVFAIATPILAAGLYFILKMSRPAYRNMQKALDGINTIVQENLSAIRTVKAYVRGEYEAEKFADANNALGSISEKAIRTVAFNTPLFQLVLYGITLCLLWFGGNLVYVGSLTVGELTAFLSYVLQVANSLMLISMVLLMLTRALASAVRVNEVFDMPSGMPDCPAAPHRITKGEICFDKVSFKYHPNAQEYVLSDISLHTLPGQTIGLIGSTGSAKSSLVQLIPRLYDISSGSLQIDGCEVSLYPLAHLRDAVGMVLQKNTLFSGTIRENLLWGNPLATGADLDWACRIACADSFIGGFPGGYETVLEQNGKNLSGGQRQRLCIARALLKKPRILIFDDSTSAVDMATEAKIRAALQTELPGTTKIFIAQRLATVESADQIFILENGRINAHGTHSELLASNAIYQSMFKAQQKGGQE